MKTSSPESGESDRPDGGEELPTPDLPATSRGMGLAVGSQTDHWRPASANTDASWNEASETFEGEGRPQSFPLAHVRQTQPKKVGKEPPAPAPTTPDFDKLFVDNYEDLVRMVCRICCGDSALAKDIVQETYIQAFRSWGRLKSGPYSPRPWLWGVARNVAFSFLDIEARQRNIARREAEQRSAASSAARDIQSTAELWRVVASLPPRQQEVMAFTLDGWKPREIADFLEIPPVNVRSSLREARKKIRILLGTSAGGAA